MPIERTSTHDTDVQEVIVEAVEYAQRDEEVEEKNSEFMFLQLWDFVHLMCTKSYASVYEKRNVGIACLKSTKMYC